jgi:hypothetical protein
MLVFDYRKQIDVTTFAYQDVFIKYIKGNLRL